MGRSVLLKAHPLVAQSIVMLNTHSSQGTLTHTDARTRVCVYECMSVKNKTLKTEREHRLCVCVSKCVCVCECVFVCACLHVCVSLWLQFEHHCNLPHF